MASDSASGPRTSALTATVAERARLGMLASARMTCTPGEATPGMTSRPVAPLICMPLRSNTSSPASCVSDGQGGAPRGWMARGTKA